MKIYDQSGKVHYWPDEFKDDPEVPTEVGALADWLREPQFQWALKVYIDPSGDMHLRRDYSRGLAFGKGDNPW